MGSGRIKANRVLATTNATAQLLEDIFCRGEAVSLLLSELNFLFDVLT